jgi:hypothetical protein
MFVLFVLHYFQLAIFAILLNARVDLYAGVQFYARILFRKILHRSNLFQAPSDDAVVSIDLIDNTTLFKLLYYLLTVIKDVCSHNL